MSIESGLSYEEKIKSIDVKWDWIKDWVKENLIKQKAINYVNVNRWSLSGEELKLLIDRIDVLLRKQDIEKLNLKNKFDELIKQVKCTTQESIVPIHTPNIKEIQNLAWVSHHLDKSMNETMKILENTLWTDNTAKIVLLTWIYTWWEILKWFTDVLKIWEGVAEWSLAFDKKDLSLLQKMFEFSKWFWIDILRWIAFLAPIAKYTPIISKYFDKLLQVLNKIDLNKLQKNINSSLWKTTGNEVWAIWDISRLKQEKIRLWNKEYVLDETPRNYHVNDLIGKDPEIVINDLKYEIANTIKNPKNNLDSVLENKLSIGSKNKRANEWLKFRLGTIDNFVKYIEVSKNNRDLIKKYSLTKNNLDQSLKEVYIKLDNNFFWKLLDKIEEYAKQWKFKLNKSNKLIIKKLNNKLQNINL